MRSRVGTILIIVTILFSLAGCMGYAQRNGIKKAEFDIADGEYNSALERLKYAESYTEPTAETKAKIFFMRAYCFEKLNKKTEAIGLYNYVVSQHSETKFSSLATERLKQIDGN